jgi:cytochrome c
MVGGIGTLDSDDPVKTVGSYWPYATTVFDYIRRAMPASAPQTLTNDEYYALTAWVLWANGLIDDDAVLDQNTLPEVVMPNRDGFTSPDPRPDVT